MSAISRSATTGFLSLSRSMVISSPRPMFRARWAASRTSSKRFGIWTMQSSTVTRAMTASCTFGRRVRRPAAKVCRRTFQIATAGGVCKRKPCRAAARALTWRLSRRNRRRGGSASRQAGEQRLDAAPEHRVPPAGRDVRPAAAARSGGDAPADAAGPGRRAAPRARRGRSGRDRALRGALGKGRCARPRPRSRAARPAGRRDRRISRHGLQPGHPVDEAGRTGQGRNRDGAVPARQRATAQPRQSIQGPRRRRGRFSSGVRPSGGDKFAPIATRSRFFRLHRIIRDYPIIGAVSAWTTFRERQLAMPDRSERLAVFIDGANLYAASRTLGFDVDYKNLLAHFRKQPIWSAPTTTPRCWRPTSIRRCGRWWIGSATTATPWSPSRPRSSPTPPAGAG